MTLADYRFRISYSALWVVALLVCWVWEHGGI